MFHDEVGYEEEAGRADLVSEICLEFMRASATGIRKDLFGVVLQMGRKPWGEDWSRRWLGAQVAN